jgi:hypothetical protein
MNLLHYLPDHLPSRNNLLRDAPLTIYDKLKLDKTTTVKLPALGKEIIFELHQDAAFSLKVFNHAKDLKEASIPDYFKKGEAEKFFKDQSLLSYRLWGRLQSEGDLQGGDIGGLNITAGQTAEISKTTSHPNDISLDIALIKDLKHFTALLTGSDQASLLNSLKVHEAMAYAFTGNLTFEISVNLLKLLSVAFAPVFSLTPGPKTPLSINPSIQIGFNAIKNDSFRVQISKQADDRFKLFLQKEILNDKTFSVSAGLNISIREKDAESIAQIIDDYFETYLGKPFSEIENFLNQAKELKEDSFLVELAYKIAFNGTGIEQLREQFDIYKNKIYEARKKVLETITATVEAGVEYKYRKAANQSTLLEATLSGDFLIQQIDNILKLNITHLISEARKNVPGIEVQNYLQEKNLTIEEHLTFGISLGNMALKSATKQIFVYDEKLSGLERERAIQIAFLDERKVTVFGEEATVRASLDAETPTPKSTLAYSEIDCSLTLTTWKSDRRIRPWDKKDLQQFLQTALVWNIFDEDESEDFFTSIWENLLKNRDVEYECKLHIPHQIFRQTIQSLSKNASIEAISEAIAASILPNKSDQRSLFISARKEFYTPLILNSFEGQDILESLNQPLYTQKYPKWKQYEITQINNQNFSGSDSFMGISNNRTFKHFQKFISAINLLNHQIQNNEVVESNLEKSVLKFFFESFHTIVKDPSGFAQRWMGYYLLTSIVKEFPKITTSVINTLTIQYPDQKNNKTALLIGGK